MDLGEKVLYHQIHPAKLTADVSGSLVSTYLMWRHKFVAALLSAFGPATIASVLVIRHADLEKRKHSPFGRYMHRYMNRRVEAWRFFGQVLIWVGAWHRVGKLVPIGWAIVVAAWTSGLWRKPTNLGNSAPYSPNLVEGGFCEVRMHDRASERPPGPRGWLVRAATRYEGGSTSRGGA